MEKASKLNGLLFSLYYYKFHIVIALLLGGSTITNLISMNHTGIAMIFTIIVCMAITTSVINTLLSKNEHGWIKYILRIVIIYLLALLVLELSNNFGHITLQGFIHNIRTTI